MPAKNKYKIKLPGGRVLGPIDLDRIRALTQKGRIQGQEETSTEPFTQWRPFSSFEELAELLLLKIEVERQPLTQGKPDSSGSSSAGNETQLMPDTGDEISLASQSGPVDMEAGESEMPTLLNLPPPKESKLSPDVEPTRIGELVPVEATRAIQMGELQQVIAVAQTKPPIPEAKKLDDQAIMKSRFKLISPKTATILAFGLVILAMLNANPDKDVKDTSDLVPHLKAFPAIAANNPRQQGKGPDPGASYDLLEKATPLIEKEGLLDWVIATNKYIYPAAAKDTTSILARSLLATAYTRTIEVLPKDQHLLDSLQKLLMPEPLHSQIIPEYVAARVEFDLLRERDEQALEYLNDYLQKTQTPELLYLKATILRARGDFEGAMNFANRAVAASTQDKVNPRHLLFLAELLDARKQTQAALQTVARLLKSHPTFGPGLFFAARIYLEQGQAAKALVFLRKVVEDPLSVSRPELGEVFLVTARALESLKQFPQAVRFAEEANNLVIDRDEAVDLILRLRAQIPVTKPAFEILLEARRAEKQQDMERANVLYMHAREKNRNSAMPLLLWGEFFQKQGQFAQAIDRYKASLRLNPRVVEAAIHLTEIYLTRYDFKNAKEMLALAEEQKTQQDRVEYLRAQIEYKQNRKERAIILYKNALANRSRVPQLYIAMGSWENEQKNQELAEFYYAIALRYDTLNPEALSGLALARFYLSSPSNAIAFLQDKLNAQPRSAPILTALAVIYRHAGDKEKTKKYLQQAIEADNKYADAFKQIGDLAREEGETYSGSAVAMEQNYKFALTAYEAYSRLAPYDPEGYKSSADLYLYIHDYGAAAKNYYQVLDLAPDYPGVRLRLSRISLNGNDIGKAMSLVNEELKLFPESGDALIEFGKIDLAKAWGLNRAGDQPSSERTYTEAANAFTKATRLDPNNANAIFYLGFVNILRGNYDNAQTLLERARQLDPLRPDTFAQLAKVYKRKGYLQKAVEACNNAIGLVHTPDKIKEIEDTCNDRDNR